VTLELAIRLTEILLGISLVQQSIEHLQLHKLLRVLYLFRIILALLLIIGLQVYWVSIFLLLLAVFILHRFQGPYNGGADRMSLLVLCCVCLYYFAPSKYWQEIAFAYLAIQLLLSYFISGWVKLINSDWRNGRALRDVFQFSAYPVSESIRTWSESPRLLFLMSWSIILFELLLPMLIMSEITLAIALVIAACFHFVNACIFGLNRFFWAWIAAYPSVLWLQLRLFTNS